MIPGDPNTLYICYGGYQYVSQYCSYGCAVEPFGVADHCY